MMGRLMRREEGGREEGLKEGVREVERKGKRGSGEKGLFGRSGDLQRYRSQPPFCPLWEWLDQLNLSFPIHSESYSTTPRITSLAVAPP